MSRTLLEGLRAARREVNKADLKHIDISSLSDDDSEIQQLLARSTRFAIEVNEIGDKVHAKLTYLFELAVSAELREEDGAYAGEHIYRVGLCAQLAPRRVLDEFAGSPGLRRCMTWQDSLPHTFLKTDCR